MYQILNPVFTFASVLKSPQIRHWQMSAFVGNADIIQGSQMPAFPPKTSLDYLIRPTLPFAYIDYLPLLTTQHIPTGLVMAFKSSDRTRRFRHIWRGVFRSLGTCQSYSLRRLGTPRRRRGWACLNWPATGPMCHPRVSCAHH